MGKLKGKARAKRRKKRTLENKASLHKYHERLRGQIKKFNDSVLSIPCDRVGIDEDLSFIDDMRKVLAVTKYGVGLAAPQIGISKRVFLLQPDREVKRFTAVINPEIVEASKEKYRDFEGCLSYPKIYIKVDRHASITIKYTNEKGISQKKKFVGLTARIVQHELDHLDGSCAVGDFWRNSKVEAASAG